MTRVEKCLSEGAFGNERGLLRASSTTTFMLLGHVDPFVNLAYCANLANFSDSDDLRLSIFDDGGHNPHFEQPEHFANVVGEFIEQTRSKL